MEEVFLILNLGITRRILTQFKCIRSILQSYSCYGRCSKNSGRNYLTLPLYYIFSI